MRPPMSPRAARGDRSLARPRDVDLPVEREGHEILEPADVAADGDFVEVDPGR